MDNSKKGKGIIHKKERKLYLPVCFSFGQKRETVKLTFDTQIQISSSSPQSQDFCQNGNSWTSMLAGLKGNVMNDHEFSALIYSEWKFAFSHS